MSKRLAEKYATNACKVNIVLACEGAYKEMFKLQETMQRKQQQNRDCEQGTLIHNVAAKILSDYVNYEYYINEARKNYLFDRTCEKCVADCVNYVRSLLHDENEVVQCEVTLSNEDDLVKCRADFIVEHDTYIDVVELKTGYIERDADNAQLKIAAALLAEKCEKEEYVLHMITPRVGDYRRDVMTFCEAKDYAAFARYRLSQARKMKNVLRTPGRHCLFCPARNSCKTCTQFYCEAIVEDDDEEFLRNYDAKKKLLDARHEALKERMRHGYVVDGYQLHRKRGYFMSTLQLAKAVANDAHVDINELTETRAISLNKMREIAGTDVVDKNLDKATRTKDIEKIVSSEKLHECYK